MAPSLRLRQIVRLLAAVAVTIGGGTVGFRLILHESWGQSVYRAVITATLAGLDTVPSTNGARALSIVMVLAGLTIIAYAGAVIVEAIAGGVLTGVLAERRRERTIERLRDHFIICGYGRVGRRVADEFRAAGVAYVVLDFSAEAIAAAREHGDLLVEGDATEDRDLERAGLEHARGLVVSSDSDADNLYVTLSARAAVPGLYIVARAADEDAEKKLKLAGADRVVLPYATAGRVMANLVLRPQVTEFLDAVTTATGPDLHLAQIEVPATCIPAGRTIRETRIRHETGAIVVALRKRDGTFDTTPEPEVVIEAGDVLVGVGTTEELRRLEDLFAPRGSVAG
jgi:voltage-gated potassium channel